MCDIQFSFYQKSSTSCDSDESLSALQTIKTWSSTEYSFELRAPLPQITTRKHEGEGQGVQCESPVAALVNSKTYKNYSIKSTTPDFVKESAAKKKSASIPAPAIQNLQNQKSNKQSAVLLELGRCFARLGVSVDTALSAGLLEGFVQKEVDIVRMAHNQQVKYQKLFNMKTEA